MHEVSLAEGLLKLEKDTTRKLRSDGLESNEYMYYNPNKGICYEDSCVIGRTATDALHVLISLKWVLQHKFFID